MSKAAEVHTESQDEGSHRVVQHEVKRKWQSYIWDSLDKSPKERKFLFKLDLALLTFASLGYFIKNLDQTNINNAFVSGMKEQLGLYGNELNYMTTAWTVGYVIGEIPSNMLLTRIRPSIWIPCCELVWTVLTMCLCKCNSATQIYILRFFIGLTESTFYPGMQYIIGSWYRKDELAKRSCIFHVTSAIAGMFSGYLMTGCHNLDGVRGFAGWQWLFIMDGVISLPIAIAGFFMLPDLPEITRAWYFNKEEISYAQERMKLEGRQNRQPYTKAKFRKIFTSWKIYALTLLYVCFNNGNFNAQPVFAQWLKSQKTKEGKSKYSIAQINNYPTGTSAVQVVTTLAYAWLSDGFLNGRRWPPMLVSGSVTIIALSSLAYWNIPEAWRWTCYYLGGFSGGISGLCFAWAHEICADDNEERAIVIATMNEMAYVLQAWLPLIVWQQIESPKYRKGFITGSCIAATMMVTSLVIKLLWEREQKGKSREVYEVQSIVSSTDGFNKTAVGVEVAFLDARDSIQAKKDGLEEEIIREGVQLK